MSPSAAAEQVDRRAVRLAEEPCFSQGCASRATLHCHPSEAEPGGQGRPDRAERSEPRSGALGVLSTDVEIGGGSPVPGPGQREPDIDVARARSGIDRAASVRQVALRSSREGGSEEGHRCVVVANESEAP